MCLLYYFHVSSVLFIVLYSSSLRSGKILRHEIMSNYNVFLSGKPGVFGSISKNIQCHVIAEVKFMSFFDIVLRNSIMNMTEIS